MKYLQKAIVSSLQKKLNSLHAIDMQTKEGGGAIDRENKSNLSQCF